MDAGHDLNLKGGTQVIADGDMLLKALNDINIGAAKDTTKHDSRTTGGKFGIDVQGGGITFVQQPIAISVPVLEKSTTFLFYKTVP